MKPTSTPKPMRQARRGNQRPKLVAPRLQTLFSLPGDLLWQRIRRRLLRPLFRSGLYSWSLGTSAAGELRNLSPLPWPGNPLTGQSILGDEFRYAGQTIRKPSPLGNPLGASLGWRREVNGFQWLDDLRTLGGPAAMAKARQLVQRWNEENGRFDPYGWSSDILSRRLRTLLLNHAFLEINSDGLFRARVLASANRQARHLARALPDGLYGAELIRAVSGLILAGLMLPAGKDTEGWVARGNALLRRELARQILPDGGHVERSPSVMLDLLGALIDIRDAHLAVGRFVPDFLPLAIANLVSALTMLRHGDGSLAGFNDSPDRAPELIDLILDRAGIAARPLDQLPATGFHRIARGRSIIVIDCGAPPPHGLDAHAHAGTLSFEFSHDNERMIVNCGAHPWHRDWRQAQATSAAHSTLIVDNTNSAMLLPIDGLDLGGMALRPETVTCRREETDGQIWLDSSHDGYEESFGLIHRRRVYLSADGEEFMGEDSLIGQEGKSGGNSFCLRFHLHPDVQASVTQNGQAALIRMPKGSGWRLRVEGGDLALAESVHLGREGQVRRAQQILVVGTIDADTTLLRWLVHKEGSGPRKPVR
jgi:uncharacterized heparinase superfamily protein